MAASHVQVQPDGTGKDIDADAVVSTEGGTPTVYRQGIIIADPLAYPNKARVNPMGHVRASIDAVQIFLDSFDSSLDTTNRWAAPTNSGVGSIAATWSAGQILLTGGTAANAYSELHSQPTFIPDEPGFLLVSYRVNLENPITTTGYRFWGIGTSPGTPTIAAPMTNGVGWDVTTGGVLRAVTYASGNAPTVVATIAAPGDANAHKYFIYFRGDYTYWCYDSFENVVASYTTGASGPDVNTLPLKVLAVSNSGTAQTIQVNAVSVGDTSRNATRISDQSFPWRQATVTAGQSVSVTANANRTQMAWGTATAGVTVGTTAVDAMIVLSQQFRAGSSVGTTGTSFAITAGKTFRVTSVTFALINQAAAVATAMVTLRYNPTGAAVVGSAPIAGALLSVPAVANQADRVVISAPDGMDLPGGTTPGQFGVDVLPTFASTAPLVSVWLTGYEI